MAMTFHESMRRVTVGSFLPVQNAKMASELPRKGITYPLLETFRHLPNTPQNKRKQNDDDPSKQLKAWNAIPEMDFYLFNSGNGYCRVLPADSLLILEFIWIVCHIVP